jgi:hypothetical protein
VVSFIKKITTMPEANPIHAIIWIAILILNKSEINPITTAPNTNPISLQNLYTPSDVARQFGCAISLIAASKLGYTMAVPTPSKDIPVVQP